MPTGVFKRTDETRRKMSKSHKGIKLPEETRQKMAEAKQYDKHPRWKGDNVGKSALHRWVVRQLGKPSKCEHCGDTSDRRYHWSNISQEYKRDINDWQRLCPLCHRAYDLKHPLSKLKKASKI